MYLIPVSTTVLAFLFFAIILKDFLGRRSDSGYILWFAIGIGAYGTGASYV